jgi:hypothetical protein
MPSCSLVELRKPLFAQGLSVKMNKKRTAVKKRAVIANFLCVGQRREKNVLKIFRVGRVGRVGRVSCVVSQVGRSVPCKG